MQPYDFTLKAEPKHFQGAVILVHMKYNLSGTIHSYVVEEDTGKYVAFCYIIALLLYRNELRKM